MSCERVVTVLSQAIHEAWINIENEIERMNSQSTDLILSQQL